MQRYNNHHEFLPWSRFQISGLNALFAAYTIRKFAVSLITLFGPLYFFHLFKEEYNFLGETAWFSLVLIYFVLQKISVLLLTYPIAALVTRWGFRISMLTGNFILAIKLVLLILAQKEISFLIPASLLEGFLNAFFWLSYHSIFIKDGKKQKFGQEISTMDMLGRLCLIAAPFLGGLIIVQFSFSALYKIALLFVLIAALPLFFMPHHFHEPLPAFKKIWQEFWQKNFRKSLISFFAAGVEDQANSVLWPFFLFLLVKNYEVMGGLTSAALLASFVFLFMAGKLVDKKSRSKVLRFGSTANGLVWMAKIFVKNIPQIFIADSLHQIVSIFHSVSFSAITYIKADHTETTQYLIWREWALSSGRLFVLILLFLLIYSGANWIYGFVLAAIASFFTAVITI